MAQIDPVLSGLILALVAASLSLFYFLTIGWPDPLRGAFLP